MPESFSDDRQGQDLGISPTPTALAFDDPIQPVVDQLTMEFPAVDQVVISSLVSDYYYDEQLGGDKCHDTLKPLLESMNIEAVAESIVSSSSKKSSSPEQPQGDYSPDVLYLHQCFPDKSLALLDQKLKQYGDVDKAVDGLLSAQFLESLPQEDRNASLEGSGKSKKSRKNKNKSKLNDTQQQKQKDVQFLQKMLRLDESKARQLYERHSNSVTKALDAHTPFQQGYTPDPGALDSSASPEPTRLSFGMANKDTTISVIRSSSPDSALNRSSELYTKAAEIYRKGKGNPLFSAAAGYYAKEASSIRDAAWIVKAKAQSSGSEDDYHGIPVHIAVHRCEQRLQEARPGQVLKFITGSGTHSVNGVALIKPAIKKLLVSRGAKFDEFRSYFVVYC